MLKNGIVWKDTQGNPIHAHGGYMIFHEGYYYWYGEDRRDNFYVSCYRSQNLTDWEFRNHILTTNSKMEGYRVRTTLKLINEDGKKVNLERPKVLYNKKTNKFVMWAHFENGKKISYLFALIGCDGGKNDTVTELSFETYQYEDGLFAAADYYSFFPSIPLLNHCKYRFDRDENEYLHTYRVKKYEGETLKSGFWDEHMFTISKSKRRR